MKDLLILFLFIFVCLEYLFLILDFFSDIDECLSNPCDANADCSNTAGSFTCKCNAGFEGDGLTCKGMVLVTFLSVKFC